MIKRLNLIRNIGQFDSAAANPSFAFTNFTLIYAENGRGKTTLATILRSLASGDPRGIMERRRLASQNEPHVIVSQAAGPDIILGQTGWSAAMRGIMVFDDTFVAGNIYTGIDVSSENRQNLHELIIGSAGIELNNLLQTRVLEIEEHNIRLRQKADAIPPAARGSLSVDEFCALTPLEGIERAIDSAERELAAAKSPEKILSEPTLAALALPAFEVSHIETVLQRTLSGLNSVAAETLRNHFVALGSGSEAWVADGLPHLKMSKKSGEGNNCPFCAQDLEKSNLVSLYQSFFSDAYQSLKDGIKKELALVRSLSTGEMFAEFESSIANSVKQQEFWAQYVELSVVSPETTAIRTAWSEASNELVLALEEKQKTPLEEIVLTERARESILNYQKQRIAVAELNKQLASSNRQIEIAKASVSTANVSSLAKQLANLKAIKERHTEEIVALCDEYLSEKSSKAATQALRDKARTDLTEYRKSIFPKYEQLVNTFLGRFNAGFRLTQVNSVNIKSGSTCSYQLTINDVNVPLSAANPGEVAFKNTLSAGDRNTLALAFFFASLYQDTSLRQKIVVIDDPMTSLDANRSLATIQELRRLAADTAQVIVLSHSMPFLCELWEGADKNSRSAFEIVREGESSKLTHWDVTKDCITEHDKRHQLVRQYLSAQNRDNQRAVAAALRPILEVFVRVAYPEHFPPGSLLGPFHSRSLAALESTDKIMSAKDTTELRDILDYANRFHHDSNPAYQSERINDRELWNFCHRTIQFTRHLQVTTTP